MNTDRHQISETLEGQIDLISKMKEEKINMFKPYNYHSGFSPFYFPIFVNELQLGTWQGIYLYEHRNHNHERKVIVNILGE